MSSMPQHKFHFKEFSVSQENCAMKVGTDGVLLGAWTRIPDHADSMLDIGTGTGLIALQLAQRSDCPVIDALEIEDMAFEQAVENFESSPWSDRLFCYHASLEEFRREIEETYDLIVSNPPFFDIHESPMDPRRKMARQREQMSYASLLEATGQLLSTQGSCAYIIPRVYEGEFVELAGQNGLYPARITRVRGNQSSPLKRSLLQFTRTAQTPEENELVIESERHAYTRGYVDLVKDFYLKL